MKRKLSLLPVVMLGAALLASTATAQVPGVISYQGVSPSSPNTNITVTFTIYDALTAGNVVWSETQNVMTDANGIWSAYIGSTGSATPLNDLGWDMPYWLEVDVNGTAMTPRTQLSTSPYAFMADEAMAVVDGSIIPDDLNAGNTPNDGDILSYDMTTGTFMWVAPSSGGGGTITQIVGMDGIQVTSGTGPTVTVRLATQGITSTMIQDQAITSSKIAPGAVTSGQLAANAVIESRIAPQAVTLPKINTTGASAWQTMIFDGTRLIWGNPNPGGPAGGDLTGTYPNPEIAPGAVTNPKLAADAVTSDKILDETITVDDIGPDAVGTSEIINESILKEDIADNAVGTEEIVNESILGEDIMDGTIESQDIMDRTIQTIDIDTGAVTSLEIRDETIQSIDIDTGAVTTDEILDETILHEDIAVGAVRSEEILDNTVASIDILDETIVSEDIMNETIRSEDIMNGTIMTEDIGDEQVTNPKLATGAVDSRVIENESIQSIDIMDGTITTADIGDGQVQRNDIQDNAINSAKIEDGTVTGADIMDETITAVDIASGAVTTDEILDETIQSNDIATGAVTTSEIMDGTVTGTDIADETITAADIASGAVTSDEILNGTIQDEDMTAGPDNTALVTNGAGVVDWDKIRTDYIQPGGSNNYLQTDATGTTVFWGPPAMGSIPPSAITPGPNNTALITDGTGTVGWQEVTSAEIMDGTVATADIANDAVTSAKIADGTIATIDIADGAVNSAKILDNTVSSTDILDGTLATVDYSDGSVTLPKISSAGAAAGQGIIYDGANIIWDYAVADELVLPFSQEDPSNADVSFEIIKTGLADGAGRFAIDNAANPSTALIAETNGTGSAAEFGVTNAAATGNAVNVDNAGSGDGIEVNATGAGDAIDANATGTGSALTASATGADAVVVTGANGFDGVDVTVTGGGDAISAINNGGAGRAGYFENSNAANANAVVRAESSGALANNTGVVHAVANAATAQGAAIWGEMNGADGAWAGYFASTGTSDGVYVETDGAQDEIALWIEHGGLKVTYRAAAGNVIVDNGDVAVYVPDNAVGGSAYTVTMPATAENGALVWLYNDDAADPLLVPTASLGNVPVSPGRAMAFMWMDGAGGWVPASNL